MNNKIEQIIDEYDLITKEEILEKKILKPYLKKQFYICSGCNSILTTYEKSKLIGHNLEENVYQGSNIE